MSSAKRVAVLMGGWSGEREVSLSSGGAVLKAVQELGHTAIPIDVTRDIQALVQSLTPAPDVVLNILHGRWGEDGRIQAVLDVLQIPYSYSNVLASALAMNKPIAKKIFKAENIPTPQGFVISTSEAFTRPVADFPYVIKPLNEGSSLGVFIVFSEHDLPGVQDSWPYGETVLVERYIPGREFHVAVMGDRALGAIEIRPKQGFYDYAAKYTVEKAADHIMPAPLAPEVYQYALDLSLRAHQALGCTGISRVDIRYDDTEQDPGFFYVLEVNTQPGMTPLSLVPEIAQHVGYSFNDLVAWMIENAQCHA